MKVVFFILSVILSLSLLITCSQITNESETENEKRPVRLIGTEDTTQVSFQDVESYGAFFVKDPGTRVFKDSSEWIGFWDQYWNVYDGTGQKTPAPFIDFSENMVIGVFWGDYCKYSGCGNESPSIEEVYICMDTLYVFVGDLKPLGMCDACVSPLHLIRTERRDLPVQFTGNIPQSE
ncbi:MAG: hypothetical protein AB7T22_15400 [Calditrichaceae bacterium]